MPRSAVDMREDSAIAVFWTLGMALGIMFTFLSPGFAPDLSAYLFGNILTITASDIALLGVLSVVLAVFFGLYLRPIVSIAFDREFARSQGRPFTRTARRVLRICPDAVHRPDHRGLPAHGGYRIGHLTAHYPADDGQPLFTPFPPHHLAIHRHRLPQLSGRTAAVVLPERTLGSIHHLFLHPYLCRMQDREKPLHRQPEEAKQIITIH